MATSAFVFGTRRKNLAVASVGGKTTFPLFDLLSVKNVDITFLCHCKIPAIVWVALGYDSAVFAILLCFVCGAVIYGINRRYLKKRRRGIVLPL
jgi:hypothetical protein